MKLAIHVFASAIIGITLCSAEEHHDHPVPEKLGTVHFPTSCSPNLQKDFERGVALLHSFAYAAAEKAFREVAAKDPKCAMAHWGIAMTYFHPLWEPYLTAEDAARGKPELDEARKLGGTERERGFIAALDVMYRGAKSVKYLERANAYRHEMRMLAEKNPDDVECQVFYALALLANSSATDQTHAVEKEATEVLEPLLQKYPEHPGIAHYLIHACDNSEMAAHALTAANKYSKIAPSAPHALHMPSHIYTRLGMWEDSIASNSAARKAARDQGDIGEELHAMDYLTYAYLQLDRAAEAKSVQDDLHAMPELGAGVFKIGYAATAMPVRYAIERRQWKDATELEPVPGAQPHVRAVTHWARAIGLARSGDPKGARREADELKRDYDQVKSAGDDYWATQVDIQRTEALAWAAYADKKNDDAVKLMRQAADQEDAIEKRPVTPGAIVPAREQLGDLLLELNRPSEAVAEFDRALMMTPKRLGALQGKARAEKLVAQTR